MPIRINKPKVDLLEKINDLDKPFGMAGEAMLRANTPQEQFNLISAGRKNLLINGNFKIWQRATSDTYTGSAWRYGSADRWRYYTLGTPSGTATISKSTVSIDGVTYDALDWNQTVINPANNPNLEQLIEDVNVPLGATVTFSYYVERVSGDGEMPQAMIFDGQNGTLANSYAKEGWNTITGRTQDDTTGLRVRFMFPRNKTFNFKIAACQLEVGEIRTPLEHRSYGEELQLCRRYYQRKEFGRYSYLALGRYQTTNFIAGPIPSFDPQIMRDSITVSYGTDTGASFTLVVINLGGTHVPTSSYCTTSSGLFLTGGTGFTFTEPQYLEFNAGAGVTGYIELDAEI